MNSGRIFTEPRSGEVNILPLFTEIEKNNCFSIYTGSDLNNIFRRKPLKIDLIDLVENVQAVQSMREFAKRIIHSVGGEKCSLATDSEPIRLLKTPRSLSVYILKTDVPRKHPRNARVTSAEELGTMSKNNLRGITLARGPI